MDQISSPRISFSADFLDENDYISISPNSHTDKEKEKEIKPREKSRNPEFEFLSSNSQTMVSADELFFEGKVLPFWQMQHSERLKNISLKTEDIKDGAATTKAKDVNNKEESARATWFLDDDPSPRPPTCTVLWKELLRLKKQRASTLSPSSSSSSSSSTSSSLVDLPAIDEGKEVCGTREKYVKRIKKGLERTRSASLRIRPVVNVPIQTQAGNKNTNGLPPLFSFRKGKLDR